MDIDIRILAVIISALVSISIVLLKEFVFDGLKHRKEDKNERLKNFYAPFYSILLHRLHFGVTTGSLTLGSGSNHKFTAEEYMDDFIVKNAGYASEELLAAWIIRSNAFPPSPQMSRDLISIAVKEYNDLKKQLKLEYSTEELKTGVPDMFKEFRERT